MRTMTKEQAELYIKAGYFPKSNDIEAIVDLQDVYGHQCYWDVKRWIFDDETSDNAETLFRLIWSDEDVDRMITERNHMRELVACKKMLTEQLQKINKELSSYEHHGIIEH